MPYYVSGLIHKSDQLMALSPEEAINKRGIDLKVMHEVTHINRAEKKVSVHDLASGMTFEQEYEKLKANVGTKEYKARHILVETEAEAKSIIVQLGKKAKFEKLATKSKDAGSAEHGGELEWAVPSNFVAPFANALVSLKKGEYTKEPVQTQFGWHVIRLDDVRDLKVPSFEELKPQLEQRMQQQTVQNAISEMRDKAKIE